MGGLPRIAEPLSTGDGRYAPSSHQKAVPSDDCPEPQDGHLADSAPISDYPGEQLKHSPFPAVSISSVVVKRGRLMCEVKASDRRIRYTNSEVARRALECYPSLSHHACVNAEGRTFGFVISHTSIAHLLEHLVIELQTQASADPSAVFVGTSEWVDEAAGVARVEVSFCDDLQALRALNDALDFINGLV